MFKNSKKGYLNTNNEQMLPLHFFCLHHNSCTFHPLKFSLIMRRKKKHKWAVQVVLGLKCHITIHVQCIYCTAAKYLKLQLKRCFSGREISKQGIYSRKYIFNYFPIHYTTMMQKVKTSKITDYLHLLNFTVYHLQNWALLGKSQCQREHQTDLWEKQPQLMMHKNNSQM